MLIERGFYLRVIRAVRVDQLGHQCGILFFLGTLELHFSAQYIIMFLACRFVLSRSSLRRN